MAAIFTKPTVALVCFLLLSAAHLYACARGRDGLRRRTKPLLMPLLALFLLLFQADLSPLVPAALLCGCAGDVLLLRPEDRKRLFGGMLCFAAGHMLYLAYLLPRAAPPPVSVAAAVALAYGAGLVWTYRRIKPAAPGPMLPGMMLYALLLCFMSACALLFALGGGGPLPLFGSLLFIVSDSLLSRELLIERTRRGNFAVMLTYIGAQSCLSLGFAFAA